MTEYETRAETLIQALPYIQQFAGHTVVVKYGGHAMTDPELKRAVMRDLVLMQAVGLRPVLVHGGGPEIDRLMGRVGKAPEKVAGMRVTDAETMELVEMALAGTTNKGLVGAIQMAGGRAVGLSGKDGGLLLARKLTVAGQDIGFVGEVERVDPALLSVLSGGGYLPVICSVAAGEDGESYNVNADLAAGALAAALGAVKLVLMTDVEGIYRDFSDKGSLIHTMTPAEAGALIASGVVDKGMIPKVQACLTALAGGVAKTHIIDGRRPHALLIELFTDAGVGTMIAREGETR